MNWYITSQTSKREPVYHGFSQMWDGAPKTIFWSIEDENGVVVKEDFTCKASLKKVLELYTSGEKWKAYHLSKGHQISKQKQITQPISPSKVTQTPSATQVPVVNSQAPQKPNPSKGQQLLLPI